MIEPDIYFSPKLLKYLFSEIRDFGIKSEGKEIRVNKSILHAYSGILRKHPKYNCIRFNYENNYDIIGDFNNLFSGKELNKELAKVLQVTFLKNTKQGKSIKNVELKNIEFSQFSENGTLYYKKFDDNEIWEYNPRDKTEKILMEFVKISEVEKILENYILIRTKEKYKLFLNKEKIWEFEYKVTFGAVAFSMGNKFLYFNDYKDRYILNLATLNLISFPSFENYHEVEIAGPNKINLTTLDTLLAYLSDTKQFEEKERRYPKKTFNIVKDFTEEFLLIPLKSEVLIIDFKNNNVVIFSNIFFRINYNEYIVKIGYEIAILLCYKDNELVQKTPPLKGYLALLTNTQVAFTGKKLVFFETFAFDKKCINEYNCTDKILSSKNRKIKNVINLGTEYLIKVSIAFSGNYFTVKKDKNVLIMYSIKTFYINPFTQEEISYLISNIPDIKIILGDEEFLFNKTVLYACSETFRFMLSDSLTESQTLNSVTEFNIPNFDFSQAEFFKLFHNIYETFPELVPLRKFLGIYLL